MIITGETTRYYCDSRDCVAFVETARIPEGFNYRRMPDGWVVVRAPSRGHADLCQRCRIRAKVGAISIDSVLWTRDNKRNHEGVAA